MLDRRGADAARLAELAFDVAGGQTPCASAPDMFFAEKFGFDIADSWGYGDQEYANNAKKLCNTECEIRDACLEYALKHNETFGIWGGTSPRDRMLMLRNKRRRLSEADARVAEKITIHSGPTIGKAGLGVHLHIIDELGDED